jgi:ketosteroid isomerase-like protein
MELSDELVRELRTLVDTQAVVQVTLRYATAIDSRDWDLFASCFAVDAVAHYHQPGQDDIHGRDAILAFMQAGIEPLTGTQHFVSNHVVSIDGDSATCVSYVASQHVRRKAEGGPLLMIAGIYRDQLQRIDNSWEITRRDAHGSWVAGNMAVVTI